MDEYVLGIEEIDPTQVGVVGGKAAGLGELSRIVGIGVPPGFCITTDAFRRILVEAPAFGERVDQLSLVASEDRGAIRTLSAEIRSIIEQVRIPDDVSAAITRSLALLGEDAAYAVRSSATAEDLPSASFAGQQDTYLNVRGSAVVLRHISDCWASLFTERAVAYRLQHGIDHRVVRMAVVVQRMVVPQAAGVLFTVDPVTSDRTIVSVEAVIGLGEPLVSGRVSPDAYQVRDGEIVAASVASKPLAVYASAAGGTEDVAIDPERQDQPALTDAQVLELARLGRRIERHLGQPQDVEWCLTDGEFQIVQSRPITTLFPVPAARDTGNHVYVSVGHQQMMTDPMKPLGLSFWQLTTPRPMSVAGGRLFVDVAQLLASPSTRAGYLEALDRSDPLIGDALRAVLDRGDFITLLPDDSPGRTPPPGVPVDGAPPPLEADPAIVAELIDGTQKSIAALLVEIRTRSGAELIDFILADLGELKRILFDPRSMPVIMAGMQATWWLNERLEAWLGEKNVADVLTRSVPHNITSQMGLALLDVADVIRPHPEVVSFLEQVEHRHAVGEGTVDVLSGLATLEGGPEALDAIRSFLERYGMRGVGEIDITRPRWAERPTTLVPLLLGNVRNFETGAGERRFEEGRREARQKAREVLRRVAALPDGAKKAEETRAMIDRVRTFSGYREYPKYGMVSRYFIYKQALLGEAERLAEADVLREPEDIFYLTLDELGGVVRAQQVDDQLISRRRDEFASYRALVPPRVFTSDGEVIAGVYRRSGVPSGALVGVPVSAGVVEGRARVIAEMGDADLEAGDILVTAYTDPSWTPAFVAIAGLVTEAGGLMTHGAVIAREYGLAAVVGVERAMELIRDGQRIRVHGTDGYVELLS